MGSGCLCSHHSHAQLLCQGLLPASHLIPQSRGWAGTGPLLVLELQLWAEPGPCCPQAVPGALSHLPSLQELSLLGAAGIRGSPALPPLSPGPSIWDLLSPRADPPSSLPRGLC